MITIEQEVLTGFDGKLYCNNAKIKLYPDGMQFVTYSSYPIFNFVLDDPDTLIQDHYTLSYDYKSIEFFKPIEILPFHIIPYFDLYSEKHFIIETEINLIELRKKKKKKIRSDAVKRARDKIYDLVALNDWSYFFTGTLGDTSFDPTSAVETLKPLQNWLANMVKRNGLKYVLVAEYQPKSGHIHWHGFINSALEMVDSGRRSYNKKACDSVFFDKHPELDREKYPVIYNMPSWKFGWTTAIKTYGENSACARYMMKYITKNTKAVFGRYYWSSRNLCREPFIGYDTVDYDEILCPEYSMPFNRHLKLKYYTFFPGQDDFHWKQSSDNSQSIIDILNDFEDIDPDELDDFEEIMPQ